MSSGVESPRPLLTFLSGLGRLHNWILFQRPIFALCFSSKGPGQLAGRGRAGTAAIQVAGVHLQLRGTHLGRKVRPSCQAVTPTPLNLQTWVARIALELCRPGWTRTPELLLPLPPELEIRERTLHLHCDSPLNPGQVVTWSNIKAADT